MSASYADSPTIPFINISPDNLGQTHTFLVSVHQDWVDNSPLYLDLYELEIPGNGFRFGEGTVISGDPKEIG